MHVCNLATHGLSEGPSFSRGESTELGLRHKRYEWFRTIFTQTMSFAFSITTEPQILQRTAIFNKIDGKFEVVEKTEIECCASGFLFVCVFQPKNFQLFALFFALF